MIFWCEACVHQRKPNGCNIRIWKMVGKCYRALLKCLTVLVIQQQEPSGLWEFTSKNQHYDYPLLMSLTCTFISVLFIWVYNFGRTGCSTFSTACPSAACFYFCYSWYLACRRCFVQAQWMEGHKYRTHTRQVATVCTMGWNSFLKEHSYFFVSTYFLPSYLYLHHSFRFIYTIKL